MTSMTEELIRDIFTYFPPTPELTGTYQEINASFIAVALKLDALLPKGAEKTGAIRKLSEARMHANAALVLEGKFRQEKLK